MIQSGIRELFARDPQTSPTPSFPPPLRDAPAAPGDGRRCFPLAPSPAGERERGRHPRGAALPGPARLRGRRLCRAARRGGKGKEGPRSCGRGRTPVREGSPRSPRARQVPPACARLARGIAAVAVDTGQKISLRDEFISNRCNIVFPLYRHVQGLF